MSKINDLAATVLKIDSFTRSGGHATFLLQQFVPNLFIRGILSIIRVGLLQLVSGLIHSRDQG